MRVLVTGGNGFIGGHVIDRLIEQGHRPVSFDRYGVPHRKDVEFRPADIRDAESVNALAAKQILFVCTGNTCRSHPGMN